MIKKRWKRGWGLAMASLLILSSLAVPAQAAAPGLKPSTAKMGVVPRWDYIMTMAADLEIEDSGWATVTVSVISDYSEVSKLKLKTDLQMLENAKWKTLKSWSETEDSSTILYQKNYAVAKGHRYRLKLTAYAYDGGTLLEQVTETYDYGIFN